MGSMAFYSVFNNKALAAAEAGDCKGITTWHIVVPQICTFLLRFIPVFLAIYLGQGVVDSLLASVPEIVTHMISVLGGVLPALGVGLLMNIVIKDKIQLVFFFLGFILLAFAKLDTIPVVFIAAVIAYIMGHPRQDDPLAQGARHPSYRVFVTLLFFISFQRIITY